MAEIYKVDASFDHGFFKGTSCAFGVFDGVREFENLSDAMVGYDRR